MTQQSRWTTQSFRASDGLRLAYVADDFTDPWKTPETIILVHAATGSSRRFYAWVPHLSRDFRVIRIDLRCHGDSEVPAAGQLTGQRLAQDVIELADHLGSARMKNFVANYLKLVKAVIGANRRIRTPDEETAA